MEKINNYTPGPWEFVKGDSNHGSDRYVGGIRECKDELWIAAVENDVDTDNTHEANAQLIALAPTLYEQHWELLSTVKRLQEENEQLKSYIKDLQKGYDH